ncbi:transcriptional regulator BetI [Polycladidibacter stylochi]|uniref:transcriptional regulator BetI n=1 Tax=Polycladidibacter stylochi TaxID=1807766 RepID=UPI000834D95A|nr:transcriptional regulator BetI [Pseudovibrio stylochi]
MPRVGQEEERRKSIIKATIEAIHENGFAKVTMAQIARKAGVSTGLPHHYFGSKTGLFDATMASLLHELAIEIRRNCSQLHNPQERIMMLVRSNFCEAQFKPAVISAWLAFYVEANSSATTKRLLRIYQRRLRSNLMYEYGRVLVHRDAEKAALGTAAMIDGFWLQQALHKDKTLESRAETLVGDYVDQCFAQLQHLQQEVKG